MKKQSFLKWLYSSFLLKMQSVFLKVFWAHIGGNGCMKEGENRFYIPYSIRRYLWRAPPPHTKTHAHTCTNTYMKQSVAGTGEYASQKTRNYFILCIGGGEEAQKRE